MNLSTKEGRQQHGARIKAAAREAGVTLEEVSKRSGCSRALIYQYVSGMTLPQSDRLQQIAAVVGKPLHWFFLDTDPSSALQLDPEIAVTTDETPPARGTVPGVMPNRVALLQRELEEHITRLRTLIEAYASPADWRRVADTCQELAALLPLETNTQSLANVLFTQGNALIHLQEWGSAKEKLQRAAALFREAGASGRALDCLQSTGHVNLMLMRIEEARENFTEVAAGVDWRHQWRGVLSLGALEEVVGDYAGAMGRFAEAKEIVEERSAEDTDEVRIARLYVEANWANLELNHGDFQDTVRRARECARVAQQHGLEDQYVEALLTAGMALLSLGDLSEAAALIQTAFDVALINQDHQRWSLALSCQSLCKNAAHQPREAITAGKEALASALRSGAPRAEILAQRALAEAYLGAGDVLEAGYHVAHGAAAARGAHALLPQAEFRALQARVALATGQYAEAEQAAQLGIHTAQGLDAKPVLLDCHLTLARTARARGLNAEVFSYSNEALSAIHAMRVPHQEWRVRAVEAAAYAAVGQEEAAGLTFEVALAGFDAARQQAQRDGEFELMEDSGAQVLWRDWLTFLVKTRGQDAARMQATAAEWPPLLDWLELGLPSDCEDKGV